MPEGSVVDADLCVIGAGAAGITIARALAGTSLQVVVLESGGTTYDAATQALYDGQNVGVPMASLHEELKLQDLRLRYLGGTTNHWAAWCRPFEPVDLAESAARPGPAWPFGRETLDPWYEQASRVCQLGDFEYGTEYWQDKLGISAPLFESDEVTSRVIQVAWPLAFGDQYRADLEQAANVRVLLQSNLVGLAATSDGGHVSSARVATLSGRHFSVRARAYVLATGGIEVARLLLASNDVRPKGLGNEHDLVGRHFMDHLSVPAGFAVLEPPSDGMTLYQGTSTKVPPDRGTDRDVSVKGAFLLSESVQRANRLLSMEVTITPEEITHTPVQQQGVTGTDVAELYTRLTGKTPATIAYVRVLGEQAPNPQSRVTIVRARDALGVPRAQLTWKPTQADRASMRAGMAVFADELAKAGVGRVQSGIGGITVRAADLNKGSVTKAFTVVPSEFDSTDFPLNPGFHHMGTARMAVDPAHGVVDPDCRVHSVDNLFIGGSAVFPTSGASTPTFTIVALALRLADHLQHAVLS